jgi:hypothetical protein
VLSSPLPTALRRALGMADTACAWLIELDLTEWVAQEPRLRGYRAQLVTEYVHGADVHPFRLCRLRYRQDPAYAEVRDVAGQGLVRQVVAPALPGQGLTPISDDVIRRAWQGLTLLLSQAARRGRVPDCLLYPHDAAERRTKLLRGILDLLTIGRPYREITQSATADALYVSVRTVQYWVQRYHLRWSTLKQEAYTIYQASRARPS